MKRRVAIRERSSRSRHSHSCHYCPPAPSCAECSLEFGIGHGFTAVSEPLILKLILTRSF